MTIRPRRLRDASRIVIVTIVIARSGNCHEGNLLTVRGRGARYLATRSCLALARAKGPEIRQAQGIALGKRWRLYTFSAQRANNSPNDWPVGPKTAVHAAQFPRAMPSLLHTSRRVEFVRVVYDPFRRRRYRPGVYAG
jgi:hypothetical protein